MQLHKHKPGHLERRILMILLSIFCLSSAKAEFRTWKDQNGNAIEAEFINTFGDEIILKDKKGKIYKLDPNKLSKEDQLHLNPPPPIYKYDLFLNRRSKKHQDPYYSEQYKTTIQWNFKLIVKFLTDDPVPEGLSGALLVIGEDEQGNYIVLDRVDGPIEKVDETKGQLEGKGCELTLTKNAEGKIVKGIKYKDYLIMLLASDGTVLKKRSATNFLKNNTEKALLLTIGDTFNDKLEKLKSTE